MARTFGGSPADVIVYPSTGRPHQGAQLEIWTAKDGARDTNLTDLNGNPLPGYVTSDEDGKIVFRTVANRDVVWGLDAEGNWWRFESWESQTAASDIVAQFPAVQATAQQASADATAVSDQFPAVQTAATEAAQDAAQALNAVGATPPVLSTPAPILPRYGTYESWPNLAAISTGTWLMTYKTGGGHLPGASDVRTVLKRSTDEGKTWVERELFGAPDEDWSGNRPVETAVGTIIFLVSRNLADAQSEAVEYVVYESTDDGRNWTEVNRVPTTEIGDITPLGTPLLLQSGDIIASYHAATNGGWGMIRSTDNGVNWTSYSCSNGGQWMTEGRMVQAADGTIIGIGRSGHLNVYFSTDDGFTFTVGVDTQITPTGSGGNIHTEALILTGNTVEVVWISRDTYEMGHTTADATELVSAPVAAWEPSQIILPKLYSVSQADVGYPAMLRNSDGDLYIIWYAGQGGETGIWSAVLSGAATSLTEANSRVLTTIGSFPLGANQIITDSTYPVLMTSFLMPLSDLGQSGQLWARILGDIIDSDVGITLELSAHDRESPFCTVYTPAAGAADQQIDSGWQPILPLYVAGEKWVQLRGQLDAAGSVESRGSTTVLIGQSRGR